MAASRLFQFIHLFPLTATHYYLLLENVNIELLLVFQLFFLKTPG